MPNNLKIALVHDWLLAVGGAEKVLKALHEMFPEAPVYLLLHDKKFTRQFLPGSVIRPSFLQRTYGVIGSHWPLIPFAPLAVESFDLSKFDLVISSSVFTKGLILKPQTLHINYCSSPTRQVWDWFAEYSREPHRMSKSWVALFQHFLRIWDRHASTRVNYYVANSENTAKRIRKYYQREAAVIYPPTVPLSLYHDRGKVRVNNGNSFFLIISRLYRHKNVHLAVKAFSKLEWPLVVIGDGPELMPLKLLAHRNGDFVKFLGYQSNKVIQHYYAGCLAFVMPQEEDFGMTPIEAMSYGKPVLALKRGGALEYVREGINGEFFEDPSEEMIADGARRLMENLPNYDPEQIKKTVEWFSTDQFRSNITGFIARI